VARDDVDDALPDLHRERFELLGGKRTHIRRRSDRV
jgi:hypothetical protein